MTTLTPRYYQREAVDSTNDWMRSNPGDCCIVLPTGSGKSLVASMFCMEYLQGWPSTRILVLTHVKELIQQNHDKLKEYWPESPTGIYSAGLKSRDTRNQIIFAGIQSVYNKAWSLGYFDVCIIDECHLIPPSGDGMYRSFLAEIRKINPHIRIIGLTATAFRLKQGSIVGHESIFTAISYEIGVAELIDKGYLCKLVSKGSATPIDTSSLRIRNGEFIPSEVDELVNKNEVVFKAIEELVSLASDRKSWLIFAASVAHAEIVSSELFEWEIYAPVIVGDTPSDERQRLIEEFQRGEIRALVSVGVLTTGFDAPNIDCVVLLRPTKSASLYIQMVGRGFRLHPSKTDTLILDFANNIIMHGPVDSIKIKNKRKHGESATEGAPVKQCPECLAFAIIQTTQCECGYEWPAPERQSHDDTASTEAILSTDAQSMVTTHEVFDIIYGIHSKKGKTTSMRVEYWGRLNRICSEWVCLEHQGFPYNKAWDWWMARDTRIKNNPSMALDLIPKTIADALIFLPDESFLEPTTITIDESDKYPEIIEYELAHPRRQSPADRGDDNLPETGEGDAYDYSLCPL